MEYTRYGPFTDVPYPDNPPADAKKISAAYLNGVEDALMQAAEDSATYATKAELVKKTGRRILYAADGSDGQFESGWVYLSRTGSRVALILDNLKPLAGTGPSIVQLPLPQGFRPATSLVAQIMGANGLASYLQQYQALLDTPTTIKMYCNGPVGNRSETFTRLSVICRGEFTWESFEPFPTTPYPGTPG